MIQCVRSLILAGLFLFPVFSVAQEAGRIEMLVVLLDSLAEQVPGLNEPTTLSLREVSLAEYIRAIGVQHQINVYIPDTPNQLITSNLVNEPVKSVFLFVCKKFSYTLEVTGTIVEFLAYVEPPPPEVAPVEQALNISYDQGLLSVDLKGDSLFEVIRTLSALTGRKIITRPGETGLLTAFLPPTALDTALEALFISNGFKISRHKKGFYLVQSTRPVGRTLEAGPVGTADFEVEVFTDGQTQYISIHAENADLAGLVRATLAETGADYLIYDEVVGVITMQADLTRLEDVLLYLFQGTDYTFKRDGALYLIGSKGLEGLKATEIVKLKYRPTFQAIDLIPGASAGSNVSGTPLNRQAQNQNRPNNNNLDRQGGRSNNALGNNAYNDPYNSYSGSSYDQAYTSASLPPEILKTQAGDVEIVDYPELNRIILKGPKDRVAELAAFLREIDRPVPMVKIEMVVVEVNRDRIVSSGLQAGLRSPGDSLSLVKSLLPGLDYGLTGSEINSLLGTIPGLSSLGVLSRDFYLRLQAQETRGNLKVTMTPVLSMLNGREASLVIGQTQYYLLETQTASTGAVNNFQTFTQRFERIEANVTLSIKPYISDDDMVTLDVIPDFTSPVGSFDANVPPTIATRRFVSTIRVKNGETVILGGLSEESSSENTRGTPFLSRIPVLKWFFGNVSKQKSTSSLVIYITPVIYYN
jgi:type IV pilus assembly protein PilQ